jgi:SRSO17 transposase
MEKRLSGWKRELLRSHGLIADLFVRSEPGAGSLAYLQGLLSGCERKNSWQLAEWMEEATPYRVQHLLDRARWDANAARDQLRDYVLEELSSPDAVLIVDETGFLKKGRHSAGVKRQYTGTAGRIENSQVGVFLCYGSDQGAALVDRELYIPQEWAADRERRSEAGIPETVEFSTKPELARRMIGRALDSGATAAWVAADEVYGHDSKLRRFLEGRQMGYVLAVASDKRLWQSDFMQHRVDAIARSLPASRGKRLSAGFGSKGERLYDWALMQLSKQDGWARALLVRRGIEEKPECAYYLCYARNGKDTLEALVRVAGERWKIEQCFETAKGECGLDHYEVRHWKGLVQAHYTVHAGPCCVICVASAWRKKLQTRKCGSAYPNCAICSPRCYGAGGTALSTYCIGPSGEDDINSEPCAATIESAVRLYLHSIYNCSTRRSRISLRIFFLRIGNLDRCCLLFEPVTRPPRAVLSFAAGKFK